MRYLSSALAGALLCFLSGTSLAGAVDINSADAELIAEAMVGVGPQKAVQIVNYRRQHGPFQHLDELSNVKGIGTKTIERNRGRVVVVVPEAESK